MAPIQGPIRWSHGPQVIPPRRLATSLRPLTADEQFDLVNFWINAKPQSVFGMGNLQFYGTENGKKSGWARDYYRARDSKEASDDPFAIHLEDDASLKKLYHDAEHVGKSAVGCAKS
jgi:hypothetical protein